MKRKLTWLVVWTVAFMVLALGADSKDRMAELGKRIEELTKQLQACGGNVDCMKKLMGEIQALSAEYAELAQSVSGTQPISGQQAAPRCQASSSRVGHACL